MTTYTARAATEPAVRHVFVLLYGALDCDECGARPPAGRLMAILVDGSHRCANCAPWIHDWRRSFG